MRRFLVAAVALCLIATGAQSFWQSRLQVSVGAVAGYQGPGDVKAGAFFFHSCARGYNAAYGTGKACEICNVSDVVCTVVNVGANGFVTIPLIGGSDCSVVTCTIRTWYDQSGNTNCTTACDMVASVAANRATVVMSALGGLACGAFAGGTVIYQNAGYTPTTAQPYTASIVGKRTSGTGNQYFLGSSGGGGIGFGFNATNYGIFASGNLSSVATANNSFHSFELTGNTTSSKVVVDSTTDTGNAGTQSFSGTIEFGSDAFVERLVGAVCEAGLFPGFSSGDDTAMTTNQHSLANGYNF